MGFRIRVDTLSGSSYVFDKDEMTWERVNTNRGHEHIRGMEENSGKLAEFPVPQVGEFLYFRIIGDWIRTTPVVGIYDISTDWPDTILTGDGEIIGNDI